MTIFTNDIANYISSQFSNSPVYYKCTGNVEDDVLAIFTLNIKMVSLKKRLVHISKELGQELKLTTEIKVIFKIKEFMEAGKDVRPYQSSEIFNPYKTDFLLYDWSIHHFHLSDLNKKEFFNKRTDKLLFVYLSNTDAYFLKLGTHKPEDENFANVELLRIILNNWPHLIISPTDIQGLSHNLTSMERKTSRYMHLNEGLLQVDDKIIFSLGEGVASNGISLQAIRERNSFLKWLDIIDNNILNPEKFRLVFTAKGITIIYKETGVVKYRFGESCIS